MDSQVPCYLQNGFHTCQTYSREVPSYLVVIRSSIFPDTRRCCGAWKPSGFLSCLPKLWLMWLKTPLQNQNTMLLSAHKHTNLKCVGANCLQNPEPFGFSSYSQALLELQLLLSLFLLLLSLLFLKAFYGNIETTLLAQQIHQSTFICFSSTKAGKVLLKSVCEAVVRWSGCEQEVASCLYLLNI